MHFIHPALAWAFLLVLVPLLIHLINLIRHQKVNWAAMEFLLESYRKHSNWIRFRQFLLLLTRMAVVAVVVAMLAQLVTPDQWSSLWGGRVTHHYVVLDDSYSMADRTDTMRVFDRGLQVVRGLARKAAAQPNRQIVSVLTFSQSDMAEDVSAARKSETVEESTESSSVSAELLPRVLQTEVTGDGNVDRWLDEVRSQLAVTELSVGPGPALNVIRQLIEQSSAENSLVYVVSDFRRGQWDYPDEFVDSLRSIEQSAVEICLVRCVDEARPNLAITDLTVLEETIAAGIPITAQVCVTNYGDKDVHNVPLRIQTKYYDRNAEQSLNRQALEPQVELLAVEPIRSIAPGQSAVRQFQFFFPQPGQHVLEGSLPEDAVPNDNHRYHVVDLPENVKVLLVDGDSQRRGASFVSAVFTPGTRTRTGILPRIEAPIFLRDAATETLQLFDTVYLINVARLEPRAVSHLEQYVSAGGSLCVFMGPERHLQFYNALYADGAGLYPLPLERDDLLQPDIDQQTPDFVVENHPVFRVFHGQRNPFLSGVTVEHYIRAPDAWKPDPQSTVRVLARLRNGQPLCVEKNFGDGRVVTFLTTVTPDWNNWARNPSFVVVLLDLQAYLGSNRRRETPRLVGMPLDIQLEASRYRSDLSFVVPDSTSPAQNTVDQQAVHDPQNSEILRASLGRGRPGQRDDSVDRKGIYEAWAVTRDGKVEVSRFALNVDQREGDLHFVAPSELANKLESVKVHLRSWNEFEADQTAQAGFHWSNLLLGALIALLLGEQAFAYWCGYHVSKGRSAT